ncbi:MAG: anti-sigma factor [Geminicoccaceae bacterium]
MTAKRKPAAKRPDPELGTLLDAGVADDRQAMEALYRAAAPQLYGRARAAVEGPAADAALVAAFLEIFATAKGRDPAANPAAWLGAVLDSHLPEGTKPPKGAIAPVQPPPEVWQRLDIAIGLKRLDRHVKPGVATMARGRDPMPNEKREQQDRALRFWRMGTLAASAVALALALILLGDLLPPPAVDTPAEAAPAPVELLHDRVALLQPLAPGRVWRVGLAGNQLSVTPLPPLVLGDDRVLRLWAVPDPDGSPQALGSLDGRRTTTIELPLEYQADGLGLGVSVESAEAPPMALPTAPFLFYGRLLP